MSENYESQIIGCRDNHVVQESSITGDTLVSQKRDIDLELLQFSGSSFLYIGMTFARFKWSGKIKGSGKILSENDKLTMRQSGSESFFLKFLRITGDMLFGPISVFT